MHGTLGLEYKVNDWKMPNFIGRWVISWNWAWSIRKVTGKFQMDETLGLEYDGNGREIPNAWDVGPGI